MLKYFNFGILLTTLGIVSVAHAFVTTINYEGHMPAPNPFDFGLTPFNRRFQPLTPMGFLKPPSKSLPLGNADNDLLHDAHTQLSILKKSFSQIPDSKANMEEIHECCNAAGKCRIIDESELCDGIVMSRYNMQIIRPQGLSTTDNKLKTSPSRKNDLNALSRKNSLNSPVKPDEDHLESPPKFGGDMQKKFSDLSGMSKSGMTSEEDNMALPGLPEGAKRIKNTNMFYVMPAEKEIQKHPYVKPDGLTDTEVNAYRQEVLKQTNMYREKYGLNPVTLNDDMNNHAQEWANILAPGGDLRHRTDKDNKIYGENLYYISDSIEHLGEVAVNAWYNELRFVRVDDDEDTFENNRRGAIGHLTQLLWKKSKDMGVGVAKNNNGGYVVVANYNPGGNVKAFYKDNLPEFTQKDIDQAKEANELHQKKLRTPVIKKINRQSSPNFSRTLSPLNPQYGDWTNRYLPNNMFGNMGPQGFSNRISNLQKLFGNMEVPF